MIVYFHASSHAEIKYTIIQQCSHYSKAAQEIKKTTFSTKFINLLILVVGEPCGPLKYHDSSVHVEESSSM